MTNPSDVVLAEIRDEIRKMWLDTLPALIDEVRTIRIGLDLRGLAPTPTQGVFVGPEPEPQEPDPSIEGPANEVVSEPGDKSSPKTAERFKGGPLAVSVEWDKAIRELDPDTRRKVREAEEILGRTSRLTLLHPAAQAALRATAEADKADDVDVVSEALGDTLAAAFNRTGAAVEAEARFYEPCGEWLRSGLQCVKPTDHGRGHEGSLKEYHDELRARAFKHEPSIPGTRYTVGVTDPDARQKIQDSGDTLVERCSVYDRPVAVCPCEDCRDERRRHPGGLRNPHPTPAESIVDNARQGLDESCGLCQHPRHDGACQRGTCPCEVVQDLKVGGTD